MAGKSPLFIMFIMSTFAVGLNSPPLLDYGFYDRRCGGGRVEKLVFNQMKNIIAQPENKNAPAQLLRLLFHDCFIEGCDASVLLSTTSNGATNAEKQASPNQTLKGFEYIDRIKSMLESICPGVVSCSDILVLAARDGISLSGGPFYPVMTGRRDSNTSYYNKAMAEIPKPTMDISATLRLFSDRNFSAMETVALLGGHNIGTMNCTFISQRLTNFSGTGKPDPTISSDLQAEMIKQCPDKSKNSVSNVDGSLRLRDLMMQSTDFSMSYVEQQASSSSTSSSSSPFGVNYFKRLIKGRGLLFSDQQLMSNEETARAVMYYSEDGGNAFQRDFAKVMFKLSNLNVLTGAQGQIRQRCSIAL